MGALSLLTRVPVRSSADGAALARAVPWFPVVGAGIGAVVAGAYVGLVQILPPLLAAALAVVAGAALTGAFHEDGLGDVADAFAGGWTKERRLEILDDPRLGTFGVLAVSGALLVRVSAVATLDAWSAVALLPAAHCMSRTAAIVLMRRMPLATPDGVGAGYAASLTKNQEAAAILVTCPIVGGLMNVWALPALVLCAGAALGMGTLARRKIGGISGDVLGATQQVAELAVLIMGAAVVHEGWLGLAWWRW